MKKLLLTIVSFLFIATTFGQVTPAIEWSKAIGGSSRESSTSIIGTADRGTIIILTTESNNGDVTGLHMSQNWPYEDVWIVKFDSIGNIQWKKTYGGGFEDIGTDIKSTSDGGYIFCGSSASTDGDLTFNHGGIRDVWIVKIDSTGNIQWQKTYGGDNNDYARTIINTSDAGYIFTGFTNSNNGDVSGRQDTTSTDMWTVKIDSIGNVQWQNCSGGSSVSDGYGILQMPDNTYWITGETSSDSVNGVINHGYIDCLLIHLDTNGTVTDTKVYGGSDLDFSKGIIKTSSGFLIYGGGTSTDGDVNNDSIGDYDFWITGCDNSGNIIWSKCLGTPRSDDPFKGQLTADNGFIFSGYSSRYDPHAVLNRGPDDGYFIKTDSIGNLEWTKSLGGSRQDQCKTFTILNNNKIVVAVDVNSNDENVFGNHGRSDVWIAQLNSDYNSIQGEIYFDANNNNSQNPSEKGLSNKIVIEDNTGFIALSDSSGKYDLTVFDSGNFSVHPDTILYFTPNPLVHTVAFTNSFAEIDSLNDFAIQKNPGNSQDLELDLYSDRIFRPGFSCSISYNCINIGNTVTNGSLTVKFDSSLVYLSSTVIPTDISSDSIVLPINSINQFSSDYGTIEFFVKPSTVLLTNVYVAGKLNTTIPDVIQVNNIDTVFGIVTGSFDPNDKSADISFINENDILSTPEIEYSIRFQNVGNDTAFNVVIVDTISPMLNVSSFELKTASHPVRIEYNNLFRQFKFIFNKILLPDSNVNEQASHGMIAYSIKPYNTIQYGDIISNTADIYFDFNEAVRTNTWLIPVTHPVGIEEIKSSEKLFIYPNPSSENIWIKLPEKMENATLRIYNQLGQTAMEKIISNDPAQQLSIKNLPAGIYFIQVTDNKTKISGSFVKE